LICLIATEVAKFS